MNFSRQLAAFLRAGIPILDAFDALTENVSSKVFERVLLDIVDALRSGSTLSDAMAPHAQLFPTYYLGILRSAELTGELDIVLDQLATYIERDAETKRTVKSALTYPCVIAVMAVVTIVILVTFVLPRFEVFFKSFHAKLPLPTRMLLSLASFFENWGLVLLVVFVLGGIGLFVYSRTEAGRFRRDRTLLKVPIFGEIVRYAVIERFCRILGSMLRAGVPIPEAMSSAIDATNNRVYMQALNGARDEMLQGAGLAAPIASTQLFPGVAAQMLRVGEQSGTLYDQLDLASNFYEGELNFKMKRLTALFEPTIIVVMGVIVGFVAIALVSAMYGIFNQVKIK
jgi:type IV pilus assembly protein PilC